MGIVLSSNRQADLLLSPCMEGNLNEVKRRIGIYIADHCSGGSKSSSSDLCAYINATDPISGNAAIHGATFSGHLEILSFLVDDCCDRDRGAGAGQTIAIDIRLKNGLGCTPVWIAAGYDRIECLQYLIEKLHNSHQLESALLEGNNTGDTPFLAAASRGNIRACNYLLNSAERLCTNLHDGSKSSPECWDFKRKLLRTANCAGDTALKVAVASAQEIELLTLLLEVDDRCQEQFDKRIDDNGDAHPIDRLEDDTTMRSKCINRKNNIGLSPLIVACERNLPSTVELLLNYGADINIRDGTGRSPLAVAAFCGCNDVVDFLLVLSSSSSSLMNGVDDNGCTPLWLAARTGNLSMVKRLVDAGADASIKSNDEMAPLDVAIKFKKERVVEFLSQRMLQ